MDTTTNRKLLVGGVAAAVVLGAGAVAGAAVGAGPFESNDSGADSPSDTTDVSTPATAPDQPSGGVDGPRTESTSLVDIPVGGTQTLEAGAGGFVTVARDADGSLRVVAVSPAAGWTFEVEPGDEPGEAEVDFRNGVGRVQFNAEIEDGVVRVRVRARGDATAPTPGVTLPDDTLPDDTLPRVDSSGPGSSNRGPGSTSSGPGSDGSGVDDHGGSGSSGPGSGGSDDSGSDDSGSDDHGGGSGSSGGHGSDD